MAQIIVDGGAFNMTSTWRCAYHPSGNGTYYIASGPSVDAHDVTFTYTIPEGAIIHSAKVRSSWSSPSTGFAIRTINDVTPSANNHYLVDVPVTTGTNTLTVTFRFRVNGQVYSNTSTHSGITTVSDIALIIDFTVPMSCWTLNKSSVEAGSEIAVDVTPATADSVHRVTWAFGTKTIVREMAAGVTRQALTVPMDWCQQIPNATSGTAAVMLETIVGGSVLGSETKSFAVTVPSSVVPTAGSLDVQGNNLTWGLYLRNRSTATLTASGYAGAQGSTIASVRIEGGGFAANGPTLTTGPLPADGTITFTLTVTDSRGRIATETAQIMVTAYSEPSITSTTEYRADEDGTRNDTGTNIWCQLVYTWSDVGSNAVGVKIEYKQTSVSAWQTAFSGAMESGASKVIGGGYIILTSAWEVRYTVSDTLGSAILTRKIPTGYIYMRWDPKRNAFGFGCYPEGEKRIQVAEDWKLVLGMQDVAASIRKRDRAYNLLDNSNFRQPINQRGATNYMGQVYGIDRWRAYHAQTVVTVTDAGVAVSGNCLYQIISPEMVSANQVYTLAAMRADGVAEVYSAKFSDPLDDAQGTALYTSNGTYLVRLDTGKTWVWAALYEGEYTADTLPAYVYKGYAAELAECQRYLTTRTVVAGSGAAMPRRVMIYIPSMRVANPTVTFTLAAGSAPTSVMMLDRTTLDVMGPDGNAYSHLYVTLNAEL